MEHKQHHNVSEQRRHHNEHKRQQKKRKKQLTLAVVGLLFVALAGWLALGGVRVLQNMYYKHLASQKLTDQNNALNTPLNTLGFTNVASTSACVREAEAGERGKPLHCTATLKSYTVFSDTEAKKTAAAAAAKLQTSLQQNGWKHGNYPVGPWFKQVLAGRDWNPDSYNYHYDGHTYCVLDFFVAYANPHSPAVTALFYCTTPEVQPPAI